MEQERRGAGGEDTGGEDTRVHRSVDTGGEDTGAAEPSRLSPPRAHRRRRGRERRGRFKRLGLCQVGGWGQCDGGWGCNTLLSSLRRVGRLNGSGPCLHRGSGQPPKHGTGTRPGWHGHGGLCAVPGPRAAPQADPLWTCIVFTPLHVDSKGLEVPFA